jgi:hypothetical protein
MWRKSRASVGFASSSIAPASSTPAADQNEGQQPFLQRPIAGRFRPLEREQELTADAGGILI